MRGQWPGKLIKVASFPFPRTHLVTLETKSHIFFIISDKKKKKASVQRLLSEDANQTNSQSSSPVMASSEHGSKTLEKYASEPSPRHLNAASQQAAAQLQSRYETLKMKTRVNWGRRNWGQMWHISRGMVGCGPLVVKKWTPLSCDLALVHQHRAGKLPLQLGSHYCNSRFRNNSLRHHETIKQ